MELVESGGEGDVGNVRLASAIPDSAGEGLG